MDVGSAVTDLRLRIDDLGADERTPRRLLAEFLAHAAEPVTYAAGANVDDWIVIESSLLDDPSHWYPEETRPAAGSLLITFDRTMYLEDDEGDFVQYASSTCTVVFSPAANGELVAPLGAAAPSGHRMVNPEQPNPEGEGPESFEGYVTSHERLAEDVARQLGVLADWNVETVSVDGDAPAG